MFSCVQKITQRNTWDLKLIDHLSEIVRGDDDEDDQTNFQKASPSQQCFLNAAIEGCLPLIFFLR